MYYEKQAIKNENENENETFVEFVKIESTCERCELIFVSQNSLHIYIRKIKCLKQFNQTMTKTSHSENAVKIITSIAFTKD